MDKIGILSYEDQVMALGQPYFLFLLLFLPLSGLLFRQRRQWRQNVLARLQNPAWQSITTVVENKRTHQFGLWLAALALVVAALARPQWGEETDLVETHNIQLMVLLDLSQSMLAWDGFPPPSPDRLTQAKQIIAGALPALAAADEVGLILFAGDHVLPLPLTPAHDQMWRHLEEADPQQMATQGTLLGPAIETAVQAFPYPRSGQPVLLILTDGEDHGSQLLPAAQKAAAAGVLLVTIGIGTEAGSSIPVYDERGFHVGYKQDSDGDLILSRLDAGVLQEMAALGNGRYLPGGEAVTELVTVINEIRATHTGQRLVTRPVEKYQPFLLASVLLLGVMGLYKGRRLRQINANENKNLMGTTWLVVLCSAFTAWLVGCGGPNPADLIAEGNEAFTTGQYHQALDAYQEAQARATAEGVSLFNTANVHYRLQQYQRAQERMLAALLQIDAGLTADAYFNLGNSYFQAGQFAEAIAAYQEVLRRTPNDQEAKHNLELALRQQGSDSGDSEEEETAPEAAAMAAPEIEPDAIPLLPQGETEPSSSQAPDTGSGVTVQAGEENLPIPMSPGDAYELLKGTAQSAGSHLQLEAARSSSPDEPPARDW